MVEIPAFMSGFYFFKKNPLIHIIDFKTNI